MFIVGVILVKTKIFRIHHEIGKAGAEENELDDYFSLAQLLHVPECSTKGRRKRQAQKTARMRRDRENRNTTTTITTTTTDHSQHRRQHSQRTRANKWIV